MSNQTVQVEVKGCPFCGGEAHVKQYPEEGYKGDSDNWWIVTCENDDSGCWGFNSVDYGGFLCREEAIAKWNHRPLDIQTLKASPDLLALIKELLPDDERIVPYWFLRSIADKSCNRPGDEYCNAEDMCITEYCDACAANAMLSAEEEGSE